MQGAPVNRNTSAASACAKLNRARHLSARLFCGNMPRQSKRDCRAVIDCNGSESARLWKAERKGNTCFQDSYSNKSNPLTLGACLADLFLLRNFHQSGTSSVRGFLFMRSKLQSRLSKWLRYSLSVEFEENIRPNWLLTPDGCRCELDFWIPSHSVAIEVQGVQHYEYSAFFHKTPEQFEAMKYRDAWKRTTCAALGIRLILIHTEDDFSEIASLVYSPTRKLSEMPLQQISKVNKHFANRWKRHMRIIERSGRRLENEADAAKSQRARQRANDSRQALSDLIAAYKDRLCEALNGGVY